MVEGIERIRTEGKLHLLPDRQVLHYSHVEVVDTRLSKEVTRRIAVYPDCRLSEAGRVQALELLRKTAMNIAPRNQVRTLCEGSQQTSRIRRSYAERESGLERRDAGQLLAANCKVSRPASVAQHLPATTDRKVVDVAGDEAVIHVEV